MFGFFKKLVKSTNNDICAICHETMNQSTNICTTSCNHKFHTDCLMNCNRKCPLCRTAIGANEVSTAPAPATATATAPYGEDEDDYLENYRRAILHRQSIEYAFEVMDRFYNQPEDEETYGYHALITNMREAYGDKDLLRALKTHAMFEGQPIDPEHPKIVVDWDLLVEFNKLIRDISKSFEPDVVKEFIRQVESEMGHCYYHTTPDF